MAKLLNVAKDRGEAPRRLEDYPEWIEAEQRITRLKVQLNEVEARVTQQLAEIAGVANDSADGNAIERQALKLVNGQEAADKRQSPTLVLLTQDMARTNQDRFALVRAVEIATQMLNELRIKLSIEICATYAPEYRKLVAAQVAAVREVAENNDKIFLFLEELSDQGISSRSLRAMQFNRAGRLSDDQSNANIYLRDAKENGFI